MWMQLCSRNNTPDCELLNRLGVLRVVLCNTGHTVEEPVVSPSNLLLSTVSKQVVGIFLCVFRLICSVLRFGNYLYCCLVILYARPIGEFPAITLKVLSYCKTWSKRKTIFDATMTVGVI